jgi:hypothetical protein
VRAVQIVLVRDLAVSPGVGEDGISGDVVTEEFLEELGLGIYESHCCDLVSPAVMLRLRTRVERERVPMRLTTRLKQAGLA